MGTYRQIFYQLVFCTKNRKPTIAKGCDEELYKYISGIIKNKKCKLYRINGIEDHIHIMSNLHPSVCLSDYIKDIKVASSLWMKGSGKKNIINLSRPVGGIMMNSSGCCLKMKLNSMKNI